MVTALIVVSLVAVFLFAVAFFLGKEMLKKCDFMRTFIRESGRNVVWWRYDGAKQLGHKPGMRNIVLRSDEDFTVLIGFVLEFPYYEDYSGYDHFGVVSAYREQGVWRAVISTYCGKEKQFVFLANRSVKGQRVTVSSDGDDQKLRPHIVCPPHWWQRWGIYG